MEPLPCFLSVSATFSTEDLRFFALRLVIELIVLLVLEVVVLLLVLAVVLIVGIGEAVVLLLILAVIVLVVGIREIVVLLLILAHKRRLLLTDNFIDAHVTPTFVVCPYGKKIKRDMLGMRCFFLYEKSPIFLRASAAIRQKVPSGRRRRETTNEARMCFLSGLRF